MAINRSKRYRAALEKVDAVFVRQEPADAIQLNSEGEIQTVREIAEGVSAIV